MDSEELKDLGLFHGFECEDSKIPISILEEVVKFHKSNYSVRYDQRLRSIQSNNRLQNNAKESIPMPKKEIIKDGQKRGNLVFLYQDIILHELPGQPHVLANASYYRFDGKKFMFVFLRPTVDSYVFDIMTFSEHGFFDFNVDQVVDMFYLGADMWNNLYQNYPLGFSEEQYEKLYGKKISYSIEKMIKERGLF